MESSARKPSTRDSAGDPARELEGAPARARAIERAAFELSQCADDALSKAVCEGVVDPNDVVEWADRAKRLILFQRERSALRAELSALADRLTSLIERSPVRPGVDASTVVHRFVERLPEVRAWLAADVEAAFQGDPAAKSFAEIVVSYPSIRALAIHRIAHVLYTEGVPLLPRIMSEYAHDRTGIDIHPGARIGRRFFIDHGTGVVIGETTEIGDNVRLYQGVTLGALSPRHVEALRDAKRHPTIEDDVTIYAGSTILGGETVIGAGSVIGGNVWLTESVPPGSKVVAEPARHLVRRRPGRDVGDSLQLHWEI